MLVTMSFPDYGQSPYSHGACNILVKPIGSFITCTNFSRIYDELQSLKTVFLSTEKKTVRFQFLDNYPTENNEWGDFQYHRKVLGLICIAQHVDAVPIGDLEKFYCDMKNLYDCTLIDSRLVIIGLHQAASNSNKSYDKNVDNDDDDDEGLVIKTNHFDDEGKQVLPDLLESCGNGTSLADLSELTQKHVVSYETTDDAIAHIVGDIESMCQSMFYILESKRLTAVNSSLRQPAFFSAPFEKSIMLNVDMESK